MSQGVLLFVCEACGDLSVERLGKHQVANASASGRMSVRLSVNIIEWGWEMIEKKPRGGLHWLEILVHAWELL